MTTNSARSDSFHAVGEQVTATLHDAHLALESYVDGDAGAERLQQCADLLHAARGALQVLEVYGASLLAEEMESICAFLLETQDEGISDEGVEALSRAMVQLPAYVERIMSGGKDIPLVLLPLLNDLRAARSKPLLSESTLLLLNLEPAGGDAGQQPERQPSGENIDQLVGKLRPQFQLGLLGWIKDSASQEDLRRMANVAERLEAAATTDEAHQLWWVTGGVLEALTAGGLDASIALKRLIGQADREIKRLQQTGESVYVEDAPVSLVNNLLYYIARSTAGGERCDAIRKAFNMSDVAPGDEQVEEVREALSAPSPKLMKTVADAIREDLAKVKDVLDIYVRTGMQDNTELQPQIALLHKISDTLGVLGLGALREVVQARGDELEQIVASQEEPQETRLIGLAAALLEVEGRLDADLMSLIRQRSDGEPQAFDETGFDEVTGAVMRECIVNLAHIKEAVTQILAHPEDIKALDGIDDQLRGISAGLMMLGKARAVQLITRVGDSIRK
jgi:chemosensory pili system protein ChpA (sensor histidine kinase/response regulator)